MAKSKKTNKKKVAPRKRHRKPPAKPRKTLVVRVRTKRPKHQAGIGRQLGAKDLIPRRVKNTFKALCEEIADEKIKDVKSAMLDGIRSGPLYAHNYLKLFRDSVDGPPTAGLNLNATFKEDELAAASRELERKMNALFKHVSPENATTADPDVSEETPT